MYNRNAKKETGDSSASEQGGLAVWSRNSIMIDSSSVNATLSPFSSSPSSVLLRKSSSSSIHSNGLTVRSSPQALQPSSSIRKSALKRHSFSISQLRFVKNKLYGRETEIQLLETSLKIATVTSTTTKSNSGHHPRHHHVILVAGTSGSGKSALVAKTLQSLKGTDDTRRPLVGCGKYDYLPQVCTVPYPGITQACRQLCAQLLLLSQKQPQESSSSLSSSADPPILPNQRKDELKQALGSSINILAHVLPDLLKFVELDPSPSTDNDDQQEHPANDSNDESFLSTTYYEHHQQQHQQRHASETQKNRFLYAIQTFLRVIAGWFPMVILMLDDLQWADLGSLSILEALFNHSDDHGCIGDLNDRPCLHRLVLVGCYRNNEVEEQKQQHPVSTWIHSLMRRSDEIQLTQITLLDLSVDAIHDMILDAMRLDHETEKSRHLARLVQNKTLGNPLHVKQFLCMLQDKELLRFSLTEMKWNWDVAEIQSKTSATPNVVQLLHNKMKCLSNNSLKKSLPMVASLGSSFSTRLLEVVLHVFQQQSSIANNTDDILLPDEIVKADEWVETCILEGFIVKAATHDASHLCYTWVHDKVQEAALALIADDQLEMIQF